MNTAEVTAEIATLLALPRCRSCTQNSNVALSNAVDSVFFSPSPETLLRLKREIEADKVWNPYLWE